MRASRWWGHLPQLGLSPSLALPSPQGTAYPQSVPFPKEAPSTDSSKWGAEVQPLA